MDALLERLDRIEAKLDIVLNGPPPDVIGPTDAMPLTGCRSKSAQYRWFNDHEIKPYLHGKYRRVEITNKVAELALFRSHEAPQP